MKRLVPFFLTLIFLIACRRNKVPDGILQRNEMVSVLIDVHLVGGYLFSFAQDSASLVQQSENLKRQKTFLKPGGIHFKQQSDRLEQQVDSVKAQSVKQQADIFYNAVYKKHHTSKTQFEESLRYYSKQPKLLDDMYSQVSLDLEKKQKQEAAILNRKNNTN